MLKIIDSASLGGLFGSRIRARQEGRGTRTSPSKRSPVLSPLREVIMVISGQTRFGPVMVGNRLTRRNRLHKGPASVQRAR